MVGAENSIARVHTVGAGSIARVHTIVSTASGTWDANIAILTVAVSILRLLLHHSALAASGRTLDTDLAILTAAVSILRLFLRHLSTSCKVYGEGAGVASVLWAAWSGRQFLQSRVLTLLLLLFGALLFSIQTNQDRSSVEFHLGSGVVQV